MRRSPWLMMFVVAIGCPAVLDRPLSAETLPVWNQWRGPTGQGHAPAAKDLPRSWSETENVVWKTPIEGKGWSSPVLADGRLWLTTALETPLSEAEKTERLANV